MAVLIGLAHQNDATLVAMRRGLDRAVVGSPLEVLPAYFEVMDALVCRFNEQRAKQLLGIDDGEWREFAKLCNHRHRLGSRHQGRSTQPLKQTTQEELDRARHFATGLIEKYLDHLDRGAGP